MALKIKRAYEPASASDGTRYLVDRKWPRGVTREELRISAWLKEIAPSDDLRTWFGHDPAKYPEFRKRYIQELTTHRKLMESLVAEARDGTVTLIFGAKDVEHCNARVLREILSRMRRSL